MKSFDCFKGRLKKGSKELSHIHGLDYGAGFPKVWLSGSANCIILKT